MTQSSQPIDQKQIIRQFYEQKIEEQGYFIDGFVDFMTDQRIGRVELLTTGDWGEYGCEGDFDSVEIEEIEEIHQTVPQSVIEAFDRHVWFSQHSLFNGGAPKWSEYPALAMDEYKRWSEKMSLNTEQDGNITRLVMFTQESVQNM